MKLYDFLTSNAISFDFQTNYIDLLKTEALFKALETENSSNIIFLSLNSDTSKDTYLQTRIKFISNNSINESSNANSNASSDVARFVILSTNPDCDFPPPKANILSYQDKAFNIEQQNWLDTMDYKDKLDMSVLKTIPMEIKHIYCHAVGIEDSRITMIPLGRDFKNQHLFPMIDNLPRNKKNILCYYNCTLPPQVLHWYGMIRTNIYQMIKDTSTLKFIDVEYCNMHPRTYNDSITMNYYKKILSSKFMICPRGCGIDTYRMWDCIYLGCIPIVEKYDGYKQFADLPILFINHWNDIKQLTEDYLENKWQEMIAQDYNYDKLNLEYWKNRIRSEI